MLNWWTRALARIVPGFQQGDEEKEQGHLGYLVDHRRNGAVPE